MTMTDTKHRIPRLQASLVAHELIELLSDACQRIEIAGSIRRGKPEVSDIELVTIPRIEVTRTDLFGNTVETRNLLDGRCTEMKSSGLLTNRLGKDGRGAWGSKYKRAMYEGVAVDLFSAAHGNFGLIFAIRTGPAEFTRNFVTQRNKGGVLPNDLYVSEGQLFRHIWGEHPELIPTPTEESFFAAIGMPWIAPEDRR